MAIDTKQYLDELLAEAGVAADDPKRQVIAEVFGNEKVSKKWSADVMRQSDYSRAQDALSAEKKKTADYYASLLQWGTDKDAELKAREAALSSTVQPGAFDIAATEKKWEERLQKTEGQFLSLLETGMSLASRHVAEFKEPLDTAALKKIAQEKNLSLTQAYDEMVAPRRAETSAATFKAQLVAAREEGARDALSKHHIPTNATPPEYHPIFDRDPKKQVGADDYVANSGVKTPGMERQLKENFAAAWNTAQGTTSSTT